MNLQPSTFPSEIPDEQRGCGTLKDGSAYLRADIQTASGDGMLPAFVRADPPIPYKESHFRSWQLFPGVQFEAVTQENVTTYEPEKYSVDLGEYAAKHPLFDDANDVPGTELGRHLTRLKIDGVDAEHVGPMTVSRSHDLLMWVGESHYSDPEDFITEAVHQGVNKRIPVSKNKLPVVNPGRTRLWLIHPNAIGYEDEDREATAGIIGYSYLTRAIYTEPEDGHVPEHIQSKQRDGLLDVVEIGEEVSYTDEDHPRHEEKTESDDEESEEDDPTGDDSDDEEADEEVDEEVVEAPVVEEDEEEDEEDDEPEEGGYVEGPAGEPIPDEHPDADDEEDEEEPDPVGVEDSDVPEIDDW